MEELKKCPFCGDEATLYYRGAKYGFIVYAKCDFCGAQSRVFNSQNNPEDEDWRNVACRKATKAWNRRV